MGKRLTVVVFLVQTAAVGRADAGPQVVLLRSPVATDLWALCSVHPAGVSYLGELPTPPE